MQISCKAVEISAKTLDKAVQSILQQMAQAVKLPAQHSKPVQQTSVREQFHIYQQQQWKQEKPVTQKVPRPQALNVKEFFQYAKKHGVSCSVIPMGEKSLLIFQAQEKAHIKRAFSEFHKSQLHKKPSLIGKLEQAKNISAERALAKAVNVVNKAINPLARHGSDLSL